ncbi:CdaR family protein [Flintibacter muris]|uniref:CdaR family protein n=1 Tax=Flintibacter muris TaxID=2941327 RepID=UPI00204147BC|nr:CdaR family protein [Flintibacter muris]
MMARLRESRWVYILLSIVLAIIFWFYVRSAVDPNGTVNIHNVRVEAGGTSVLTSQGLTVADIDPQVVELRVEGPTSARTELLRNRSGLYVRVDVSSCVEGVNTLRYRPVWPENVNVDDLTAETSTVIVTVEKLHTKTFDVQFQLDGKVAENYQMGTPAIEPVSVVVGGPVEQVNQVDKVAAILKSEELSERFAGDLPLVPLDKEGNPLTDLEITLSAETAYVVVPVVVMKEVPLAINLLPGGGATEDDAKWNIEPSTIIVSGSETDLAGLEEISLGSVSLSNVVGTKDFTFPITLDPSLTNESGLTTATVTVTVEGLDTEVFAVSNIRTINPPDGYLVDVVTQSVLVTVRGPAEDLEKIDASQIRVVVDLSNITTQGTQLVTARVYLDGTSTVGVVGSYPISVNISR